VTQQSAFCIVNLFVSGVETMSRAKLILIATIAMSATSFPSRVLAESLPPEVEAFIQDRDLCDHFRGEPYEGSTPEQIERRSFIRLSLEIYCPGTDRRLAALLKRYQNDARIVARLSKYESKVEGTPCIDSTR
jgi:hypothetical protein